MKKLLLLFLVASCTSAFALGPQTNAYNIVIDSSTGSDFNQFKSSIGSYSDQAFVFGFDQTITGSDCYFKMSQNSPTSSTGRATYLYETNLTVSTTNVTFSIDRTNLTMRLGTYLGEVYADDSTGSAKSIARGKVILTRSLFDGDTDVVTQGVVTSLTSYVRKDGDLTQMSGLGGTSNQVWESNGDGTGAWADAMGGDITAVTAGTGLSGGGSSGAVTLDLDTNSVASLLLADSALQNGDDNTNLVNGAGYLVTGGTGSSTNLSDYNNDSLFLITGGTGASTNLSDYFNDVPYLETGDTGASTNLSDYFNDSLYLITGGTGASTNNSDYFNDAGYGVGDFLADGSVPMAGNFNAGNQNGTNFASVGYTGTTNLTTGVITIGATNYMYYILAGSTTTNLMALEY